MKKKKAMLYTNTKKESLMGVLKKKKHKNTCDHKVESSSMVEPIKADSQEVRCLLCGANFSVNPKTMQQAQKAVNEIQDMLNCIKLTGSTQHEDSLPDEILEQIADVQVFLESLPKIYKKLYLNVVQPEEDFDELRGNSLSNGIVIGANVTKCGRDTMDLYYKKNKHKNKKHDKNKKKKKKKIDKDILCLFD